MDGKRLRELRKNRKMTQEQLGEIINVTKVSVSGYENENRSPDTDTLEKLADFFSVSTDYLLGRTSTVEKQSGEESFLEIEDEKAFRKWAKDSATGAFFSEILESDEAEIEELREIWELVKKRRKK